jgi:hypothetical protein
LDCRSSLRLGDVLVGDTTENVNASDVSLQSGQVIDADIFRSDIIANGVIKTSDISAAKSKSGSALP